jgi:hypothetical protein
MMGSGEALCGLARSVLRSANARNQARRFADFALEAVECMGCREETESAGHDSENAILGVNCFTLDFFESA